MQLLTPLLVVASALSTLASPLTTSNLAHRSVLARRAVGRIENVSFGGSGCPAGSTLWGWGDADHFVYLLPIKDFSARSGPNIPLADSRANCQLSLSISHPRGTQYSIEWTRLTGYARLSNGASARHQGLYYFSGQEKQTSTWTELNGPFNGEYEVYQIPEENWSACGGGEQLLSIANSVRINNGDGLIQGRAGGEG